MSTQNHKKVQIQKINSHPYFKLLLPIFICLAVVLYAIINLTQPDGFFTIPLNSLTGNANYTGYISHKDLKSILSHYEKDILIDALFSVSTNDQLIKLLDYLHQLKLTPDIPFINKETISSPIPTSSPTAAILPVQSDNTWQNISYHNKYLPEYHLIPMSHDLLNSHALKPSDNKPKHTNSQKQKPNAEKYDQLISLLIQRASKYKNITWYKLLSKYKIQLQTITLNFKQIFVTHPINERFTMYPKDRMMEYFLCNAPHGYGNGLSVYWGARSVAYWMNYNFKINCKNYQNDGDKNKLFSAFLPYNIASDANMDNSTDLIDENKTIITFWPEVDPVPGQHSVIHPTSLTFMYYNPYFQRIMNYETMKAYIDYYEYINGNDRIDSIDKMSDTNDIVIHIRCGDVLQLMHHVKDWDYGFLTMGHYKYVMNVGLKKKFGINWYDKMTNETTVWVLSQLSHKSARQGELKAMKDCEYLIHYVVDNGLREIFEPANIKIMYDSDVNDDFYRMLVAPLLFCSPSTYCFNAGIANMDGIVVMPNRGAWVDFKCIDDDKKNDGNGTAGNYMYVDAKNQNHYANEEDFIVGYKSNLLPQNQLVIDTEKAGWHCNKIDNYNFDKQSYKQNVYAQKLAEYLIEH